MLIDVGTTIYCSSPTEDNHDVDNIISPHKNSNSVFFLASHFVKPPCDIIISFPYVSMFFYIIIDCGLIFIFNY